MQLFFVCVCTGERERERENFKNTVSIPEASSLALCHLAPAQQ